MKMNELSLVVLPVAFLSLVPDVESKCSSEAYMIRGVVKDLRTQTPLTAAKVFVFFNDLPSDEEADSRARFRESYPDSVMTSHEGKFEAACSFYTWSGMSLSGGDVCNNRFKALEFFILRDGYLARREQFTYQELRHEADISVGEQGLTVIEFRRPFYLRPAPTN